MKKQPSANKQREAIEDQAAHWVVRLNSDPDDNERALAEAWIYADPRHSVAFAAAEANWEAAARIRTRDAAANDGDEEISPARNQRLFSRRAVGGALLAASGVAALGAGWQSRLFADRHATRRGQRSLTRLADGSSIALNTETVLDVSLDGRKREVKLVRGEALFDVSRDAARPFIVDLGDARVEVLGTKFNIRKREDVSELTVTHGLVAVIGSDGETAHVSAGETTLIRPGILSTTDLDPDSIRQRLAWNEGFIELNSEPLEAAVAEFNRYRDQPLVIGDPRIASVIVGGRFGVDEGEEFVSALESSFGIKAQKNARGAIILYRE